MRKSAITDNSSDTELLRLSAKGNEEAFLILYRRHRGPVFRFALHMSGNRETAEEVTQEVFLAILSDGRQYVAERGSLESYLIGVTRNLVRRRVRAERRASSAAELIAQPELLENLSREEDLRALHRAILSLPANYREVVALCDLEGLAYAQVAEQLGCAVGTIRSRLHRARCILEKKLKMRHKSRMREGCPV